MRRILLTVVVLVCFVAGVSAVSAAGIWVSAKGFKQGVISGGGTGLHAAEFAALSMDFEVAVPSMGGLVATGKPLYKPIRLYRALDAASVKLFESMTIGELVDPVVISVWGPTPGGTEQIKYQITLGKARVSGIRYLSAYSPGAPSVEFSTVGGIIEEVSLTFDKIEMTHPPTGVTAMDADVSHPVGARTLAG